MRGGGRARQWRREDRLQVFTAWYHGLFDCGGGGGREDFGGAVDDGSVGQVCGGGRTGSRIFTAWFGGLDDGC